MSVTDLLLKVDTGKLKLPEKKFEIKRLSEITGTPVIFTLKGVSQTKYDEIREMATQYDEKLEDMSVDVKEMRSAVILEGVAEPNLRDKKLLDHYGVKTPNDLLKKLFTAGESDSIYGQINILSGYGGDSIEEVKKQ